MLALIASNPKTIIAGSLAGCSDLAFRLIAREQGAEFCFLEMSDSNSLVYASREKAKETLLPHPKDVPVAAQLLGDDPVVMLKAARRLLEINPQVSILDINAACPMRKVIKKFSGAYLLQTPAILCRIIDRLAAALALPITVKLRIGYAKRDVDKIVGIARQCEQAGAQAIFVHGRTQAQLYSGGIDYASIKAIKENVKIPVIASGNIFSPQKAKEMLELTGSDGVWVARGALGNPWIFRQIKTFLTSGGLLREPSFAEKMEVLKRHLSYVDKYKLLPPRSKVGIGRKVALWYLKGFKHAAAVRAATCRIQTMDELFLLLDRIAKMPEVLA